MPNDKKPRPPMAPQPKTRTKTDFGVSAKAEEASTVHTREASRVAVTFDRSTIAPSNPVIIGNDVHLPTGEIISGPEGLGDDEVFHVSEGTGDPPRRSVIVFYAGGVPVTAGFLRRHPTDPGLSWNDETNAWGPLPPMSDEPITIDLGPGGRRIPEFKPSIHKDDVVEAVTNHVLATEEGLAAVYTAQDSTPDAHPVGTILVHPTDITRGAVRGVAGWSTCFLDLDGNITRGQDNLFSEPPAGYVAQPFRYVVTEVTERDDKQIGTIRTATEVNHARDEDTELSRVLLYLGDFDIGQEPCCDDTLNKACERLAAKEHRSLNPDWRAHELNRHQQKILDAHLDELYHHHAESDYDDPVGKSEEGDTRTATRSDNPDERVSPMSHVEMWLTAGRYRLDVRDDKERPFYVTPIARDERLVIHVPPVGSMGLLDFPAVAPQGVGPSAYERGYEDGVASVAARELSPSEMLTLYRNIESGKVKLAQWRKEGNRWLLDTVAWDTIGQVFPTMVREVRGTVRGEQMYGARFGTRDMGDDASEACAKEWVAEQAKADGWAIVEGAK